MRGVSCLDCKHTYRDEHCYGPRICRHPIWILSDVCHPTNYSRREVIWDERHEKPELINAGCKCLYWKRKWWKFWRRK